MAGGFFAGESDNASDISSVEDLNDLGDVTLENVTDNQILRYNATDSQWENEDLPDTVIADDSIEEVKLKITNAPQDGRFLEYTNSGLTWTEVTHQGGIQGGEGITVVGDTVSITDAGITNEKMGPSSVDADNLLTDNTDSDLAESQDVLVYNSDGNLIWQKVGNGNILDNAITVDKIASTSVTEAKMHNDSVSARTIVDGAVGTVALADGSITAAKIPNNTITATQIADNTIDTGQIADGAIGRVQLDITNTGSDGQVLSRNGDRLTWIDDSDSGLVYTALAGGGLTETSRAFSIADGGVDTTELADNAVTNAKIADNAVDTAQIADDAVDSAQIADGAIDTAHIGNDQVTGAKINTNEIQTIHLSSTNTPSAGQIPSRGENNNFTWVTPASAVTYSAGDSLTLTGSVFSVTDGGIGTTELADNAVTASKIADNTITGQQIADDAVDTAEIADGAVETAQINDAAVTIAKMDFQDTPTMGDVPHYNGTKLEFTKIRASNIDDNQVTTAKIPDDAITEAKLAIHSAPPSSGEQFLAYDATNNRLDWADITGNGTHTMTGATASAAGTSGTVPAPAAGDQTDYLRGDGTWAPITPGDNTIGEPQLNVSNSNLADGRILVADSDAGGGMSWSTVADAIGTGGITTTEIADSNVTTAKIADSAITEAKLNITGTPQTSEVLQYIGGEMTWRTIRAGNIEDGQVGTAELTDNAVTIAKMADDSVGANELVDNSVGAAALNVSGNGTSGQFLSTDGDGSFSWSSGNVYTADGSTLDLTSNEFSINDGGVDTTQLANDAVTADKIATDAVTNDAMADNSVNASNLVSNAVTTVKIQDNAITNAKMADDSVGSSELINGAVVTAALGDTSVTTAKVTNGAITEPKLAISGQAIANYFLAWNGTAMTWMSMSSGSSDHSRLNIALSPSSLSEGDANTTITITLSIANALSNETISGQSVTVLDPDGHNVSDLTGIGNSWTFSANPDGDVFDNLGNGWHISATANFTVGSTVTPHSATATLPVQLTGTDWFTVLSTGQPTATSDMTDQGQYNSPESITFTGGSNSGNAIRKAYIALPMRTGFTQANAYSWSNGNFPLTTPTALGAISTDYWLYRISDDDFFDTDSFGYNVVVTEA